MRLLSIPMYIIILYIAYIRTKVLLHEKKSGVVGSIYMHVVHVCLSVYVHVCACMVCTLYVMCNISG